MGLLSTVGNNIGIARQMGRLFVPRQYKLGDIDIDTVLRENHSSTATVTRYPVELGASMADHVSIEPEVVNIRGLVSDLVTSEFVAYGLTGTVGDITALTGKDTATRSQTAWARLVNLKNQRVAMVLSTNLRTYSNMVITALSSSQDKDTSQALFFSATLEEVLTVDVASIGGAATYIVPDPVTETAKDNQSTSDRMTTKKVKGILKPSDSTAFSIGRYIGVVN